MADKQAVGRYTHAECYGSWIPTGAEFGLMAVNLSHDRRLLQDGDRVQVGPCVNYDGYSGHELRMGIISLGDVALVTESGVELLTRFPRELYEN